MFVTDRKLWTIRLIKEYFENVLKSQLHAAFLGHLDTFHEFHDGNRTRFFLIIWLTDRFIDIHTYAKHSKLREKTKNPIKFSPK